MIQEDDNLTEIEVHITTKSEKHASELLNQLEQVQDIDKASLLPEEER